MGGAARLWAAALSLCLGAWVAPGVDPVKALILAIVGAFGCALRTSAWVRAGAVLLLCFGIGCAVQSIRLQRATPLAHAAAQVVSCEIAGEVLEHAGALGTTIGVKAARCRATALPGDPGVVVVDGTVADPGATVVASGWLLPLGDDGFARARRDAGAHAYLDRSYLRVTDAPRGLRGVAARIRRSIAVAAQSRGESGGLLLGLTIGDTSALDDRTTELFRRAGLSHLVAVSGSNVAMIVGAAMWLLRNASRAVRVGLGGSCLAVFMAVVGPDPSVLRAGAMAAIVLVAVAGGRRADPVYTLPLAVATVVAARPSIVRSVGLHLSAAATTGIVLWAAPAGRRLRLPDVIGLPLAVTCVAQAAVAPILIAVFGELSVVAPVANLLALPAVAPATVLGLSAGVAGLAWEPAGRALAAAASPCAAWILWVGGRFGTPSWAAVELPGWLSVAIGVPLALGAARAIAAR